MKLSEILNLNAAMAAASQDAGLPFSGKIAIARNAEAVKVIVQTYDTERVALCEKHADKDDNGKAKVADNAYVVADTTALNADLTALLETEHEVTLHKLCAASLDATSLPFEVAAGLLPMIEE